MKEAAAERRASAKGANGEAEVLARVADKWKTRYGSLNFTDASKLDAGVMWPCSYAVTTWSPDVEAEVERLIRQPTR